MIKSIILVAILILSFNSSIFGQKKDTLYFKHNDKLLLERWQNPSTKEFSYGIKGVGNNGLVYFLEQKKYKNLSPKKINTLKKLLKKQDIYTKIGKLDDWKLNLYFDNYIIFLIKGKEFIKIEARYEID